MSEHVIENSSVFLNFFDKYNYDWRNLNKEEIKKIIDEINISNKDLSNYIIDVDNRCFNEQNKRDKIYELIIENNLESNYIFVNNQLCRLDLNKLKINKENLINYLLILSNILKEKNKLLSILKNSN